MVKVVWTDLAIEDLKSIFDYISQDSRHYAFNQIQKIQDRVDQLANFPESGRIVPEFQINHYRELIEGNYRILYRLFPDRVDILRIHHTSRKIR